MTGAVRDARERVAVIGAGISGLTAAYLLQRRYDVTLYESDGRLGGHAHTHDIETPDGRSIPVDSGFIVHNNRTYPNLLRLFDELDVKTQPTDMSMSVHCEECGLEYAGARGVGGLFAAAQNGTNPRFLRMLVDVKRFHRRARRLLDDDAPELDAIDLRGFLEAGRYSQYFVDHFMIPLVSCVWSCPPNTALEYPARYLFRFLDHHGMLSVKGSPQWRTVEGGSRTYVERAAKELTATESSTPVRTVRRTDSGVDVIDDDDAVRSYRAVVVATHADQALALLDSPTKAEQASLETFAYSENTTVLHTDASLLPRHERGWASWNYRISSCRAGDAPVQVSYHMNRLQRMDEDEQYLVTLNADDRIDASRVLRRMHYTHPIYTRACVAAQRTLPSLNDGTVAYAGAYHGWGFHEDGCAAGVRAAESLGVTW